MSIKIDLMIAFFVILFCLTSQIEIYLILLLFAVIHEIGHLIAGIFLGFKPKEIQINIAGVRVEFKPKIEEYNYSNGRAYNKFFNNYNNADYINNKSKVYDIKYWDKCNLCKFFNRNI